MGHRLPAALAAGHSCCTLAIACAALACAAPRSPAPSASVTPLPRVSTRTAAPPASVPAPATQAPLITSPCVLHAGGGQTSARVGRRAGAAVSTTHVSCWFGAECVAAPGAARAGDGFVDVRCEDADCRCTWRSATTDEGSSDGFALDEPPTDASVCRRVLLERCLRGMNVLGGAGAGSER